MALFRAMLYLPMIDAATMIWEYCTPGLPRNLKKIYFDLSKLRALKCLENKVFVREGLKKSLNFWGSQLFVEMFVAVKRMTPSIFWYFPADNVCTLHAYIPHRSQLTIVLTWHWWPSLSDDGPILTHLIPEYVLNLIICWS